MVQFLSINFFVGFLQFLLGFSKISRFFCVSLYKFKFIIFFFKGKYFEVLGRAVWESYRHFFHWMNLRKN